MADLCEIPHPDHPEVLCDKPKPCYAYCCNSEHHLTWNDRPIPGDKRPDPARMVDLVQTIRRYNR